MPRTRIAKVALVVWAVLLAVIGVRVLLKPHANSVAPTFTHAGENWRLGRDLYAIPDPGYDLFRYSPPVAVGFIPFSYLPDGIGGVLWRGLNAAAFLTALAAWCGLAGLRSRQAWVVLLVVPLALQSLNNGQANPLVLGLVLGAAVVAATGRWTAAAALLAGAVLFKGYPIALALLVGIVAPGRLLPRLVLAIGVGLALPYLLGPADYVTAQYRGWWERVGGDDRTAWPLYLGYQDFHLLLRVAGVQLPLETYRIVQAAAGAALAALIAWQRWRGVPTNLLLQHAASAGCCWMALFGPATETSTLILIAPLLAQAVLPEVGRPRWVWGLGLASYALFLTAVVVLAFPHAIHRPVIATGIQPLAVLLLTVAVLADVVRRSRTGAPSVKPVGLTRAA
jgi:hypothetical protein